MNLASYSDQQNVAEVATALRGIAVFIFIFSRALGYHVKKCDYSAREGGYLERKALGGERQKERGRERTRAQPVTSHWCRPSCSASHVKEVILDPPVPDELLHTELNAGKIHIYTCFILKRSLLLLVGSKHPLAHAKQEAEEKSLTGECPSGSHPRERAGKLGWQSLCPEGARTVITAVRKHLALLLY